jgi:uncharacterized LabA/DUF88 family protein
MAERVIVFVDYQNMYNRAREVFHSRTDPAFFGQVDPRKLGDNLALCSNVPRELTEVRVYRGRPDSLKDPRGYGANLRQAAVQEARGQGKVKFITRALQYPSTWPAEKPREKGIDVALAVDFVTMAVRREYDVGIMISTDTDLVPALEAVIALPSVRCEVAAFGSQTMHCRRLSVKGSKVWCHWIDHAAYMGICDHTDYNQLVITI